MTTATMRLVDIVRTTAESAGPEALDFARLCLLDWLGVTLAGAHDPLIDFLVADSETVGAGHRLIGRAETASLRDSVLINGAAGHVLDYDDGMPAMMGHPSVAILPSLVMLAASRGIDGDRLLRAVVAGAEAAGRFGLMLGNEHYFRGFHSTGTIGAMSASLGAAGLLGLDPDRAAVALGLAATRAAGLKASFGTDGKPLHAGWAALVALTSALWAERGMTGARDVLGHAQGIRALTSNFDAERGLGEQPMAFVRTVTFKVHAACAVTHPAIDAALALKTQSNAPVESVLVEVAEAADNICNIPAPATGMELKFSLRGVTAMALAGIDTSSPASFSEAPLADPEMRRLMACTQVRIDPALALGETRVALGFADGASASGGGSFDDFERDPAILHERLRAKFSALVSGAFGAQTARRAAHEIMERPGGPDAAQILAMLSRQA